jgi:putative ABC transport system substrate-binding protein
MQGAFLFQIIEEEQTMKKTLSLVIVLLIAMTMVSSVYAEGDKPLIGIVQLVDHPALDAARDGFLLALTQNGLVDGENITIDYRNAQNNQDILSSISDHFVAEQVDLVLAIATPAAQAIAGKTEEIPILATAITDFVVAGLAQSNEKPGWNVSGTTDMNPVEDQIRLILKLAPETKTIGLIYTNSEANSVLQADIALKAIEDMGLKSEVVTVNNSNDVQQATQDLVTRCDAIYIPTDNTLASAMSIVSEVTMTAGIPVICGERNQVVGGGTATLGIDYFNLGQQTGEMAVRVLNGEKTADMPIEAQKEFEYAINKTVCDLLGINIPEELLGFAFETE